MHFLIVDDDAVNQLVLKVLLEEMGHSSQTASSAEDALLLLSECQNITAVFTDLEMPRGLSGLELRDRLRLTHPDIPVIVVTGYPQDRVGLDVAFLSKPVLLPDLMQVVSAIDGG